MEEITQNPNPSATPKLITSPSWKTLVIILAGVLIFLASVSVAYWLGLKQAEESKPIYEVGQTVRVGKLHLTVNKAQTTNSSLSFIPPGKQALFLNVTFENRDATEGKDTIDAELRLALRDFRLTDEEGFVWDPVIPDNAVQEEVFKKLSIGIFIESFTQRKLARGENYSGYLLYVVPKEKPKFVLIYKGTIKFFIIPPFEDISLLPTITLPAITLPEMFGPDNIPENAKKFVELAKDDIVKRLKVKREMIKLIIGTSREWGDSSLGCAKEEGYAYLPMITPGYDLTFMAGNKFYNYHTNKDPQNYAIKLCGEQSVGIQ